MDPNKKCLQVITHEGDDEGVVQEKMEKALAEHVARHPKDIGLALADFSWTLCEIVDTPRVVTPQEAAHWHEIYWEQRNASEAVIAKQRAASGNGHDRQ